MSDTFLTTDLPVLTDIVEADGSTKDIPMLTEIIPVTQNTADREQKKSSALSQLESARLLAHKNIQPKVIDSLTATTAESNMSPAEVQRILDHFTEHLESVFTAKLDRHLQQLHHQAIRLAIMELREELPELMKSILSPSARKK